MSIGNTVSISTNLNVNPYFDDFDETKNHVRILYRPGLAVQGRELTQMQTIQDNQRDRLTEHIFREGSVVRGCEVNYDQKYSFVKLRDLNASSVSVNAAAFVGSLVTGGTTGVKAVVINSTDGSQANTPDLKTLFVKYVGSGPNGNAVSFAASEVLTSNTLLTANVATGVSAVGDGSAVSLGEGIVFAKDFMLYCAPQTVILEKYASNSSFKVGYQLTESIVTEEDDQTLLDPAQGSYNYAAPGATRLKIATALTKKALSAVMGANFAEILTIKDGVIQTRGDKPQYSDIRDYLAQRTAEESGDYLVKGLSVRIREHKLVGNNQGVYTSVQGGNSFWLSADVEPGKAYVKGYDTETLVTNHVPIKKGTDYSSIEAAAISSNYGGWVLCRNMSGSWDLKGHNQVTLRSIPSFAVSNGTYSTTTAPGLQRGTARARAVVFDGGTPGTESATYRVYLYDVQMGNAAFSTIRSVFFDASSLSLANGKADVVANSGSVARADQSFDLGVFRFPARNIRRLRDTGGNIDTDFEFQKTFDVSIASDSTFTVSTGDVSETMPYSIGALNTTQKRSILVTIKQAANTSLLTGTVATTATSNTVTGTSTDFTGQVNAGDRIQIAGYSNTHLVTQVVSASSLKVLTPVNLTLNTKNFYKKFIPGQIVDLGGVGKDGSRSASVSSSTSISFDLQETLNSPSSITGTVNLTLNKVDGREKAKTIRRNRYVQIRCSNNAATTIGPWNLGLSDGFALVEVRKKGSVFAGAGEGTDVTSHFTLNSGMLDSYYGHAKLEKKAASGLSISSGDYLLVKLDYFAHDTTLGVGYFSVDSYPIDDVNGAANTAAITTAEIPIFVSPTDGSAFSLRDNVDIRPRLTDTATDTTTVGSASINPGTSSEMVEPSGGLHFMPPDGSFEADLDYYLRRKDLVVMSKQGVLRIISGNPSLFPITPGEPGDSMSIAKIDVAPWPSLPDELARRANRPDLACAITPARNERYQMRDIGAMRDRLDRLEYYTSLNLLEKDAKDLNITDAAGLDRFKNGILVDSFTGHNIGNVYDPDYKISVDSQKGEIRPPFKLDNVELFYAANSSNIYRNARDAVVTVSSNTVFANGETITAGSASGKLIYQVNNRLYISNTSGTYLPSATATGGTTGRTSTISLVSTPTAGDLATLPYFHEVIVSQPLGSGTRNLAGLLYSWKGAITLDPDSDYWLDTTQKPDVQVNFDFNTDNWQWLANAWGTQWGDWQTNWSGVVGATTRETVTGSFVSATGEIIESFINETAQTVESRQTRNGTRVAVTPVTTTQRIGARVVDTNIVPFMRSRMVKFHAQSLKPSTRVYAFFDGENVTSYCSPANSSFANTAVEGTRLISDDNGELYGLFRIPAGDGLRFRTGSKTFRLTDSSTNQSALGSTVTAAETTYTAQGLTQTTQDTVISTRQPQISTQTVSEARVVGGTDVSSSGGTRIVGFVPPAASTPDTPIIINEGGNAGSSPGGDTSDPLAQTFTVQDVQGSKVFGPGVFATKIDLYFETKDSIQPLIVEIREVDPSVSYVTARVVPFSRVIVPAADVNISDDGSAPTPVVFPAPVFLVNGSQYALAIIPGGGTPNYRAFTARLGENDLLTGARITKQAASGILFASSNDKTYTSIQEEDLKFRIWAASFDSALVGNLILKNEPRDFLTVTNVSAAFSTASAPINGETTLVLTTSPTINLTLRAFGNTSGANGTVTYTSSNTVRVKDVTLARTFAAGELVTFYHANGLSTSQTGTVVTKAIPSGTAVFYDPITTSNTYLHVANSSGTFAANTWIQDRYTGAVAYIHSIDRLQTDVLHALCDFMSPEGTSVNWSSKMAKTNSTRDTTFQRVNINADIDFGTVRYVLSRSTEVTALSGERSLEVAASMQSTSERVSPVVDLRRTSATTVENLINNDSAGEANTAGGNAKSRYITRKVTLADGQDAEDLRVFLTGYKPAAGDIEVYYKILHGEDSDTLAERPWVEMTLRTGTNTISDNENTEDFKELEYGIPTANLTGSLGQVQYTNTDSVTFTGFKTFAIKIVLLSSNTTRPPRVRDQRTIALQV